MYSQFVGNTNEQRSNATSQEACSTSIAKVRFSIFFGIYDSHYVRLGHYSAVTFLTNLTSYVIEIYCI